MQHLWWAARDALPAVALFALFLVWAFAARRRAAAAWAAVLAAGLTLTSLLGRYRVRKGDIYYVPAGTIHTIGPGILIAEIQETSDVSYRISDWDRVDADGSPRALHTEEAAEAISFGHTDEHLYMVPAQPNAPREALSTPFFTTNLIRVQGTMQRDYGELDCFVIYVCTEGSVTVRTEGGEERIGALETLLLPAELDEARLTGDGTLLEIYIK